MKKLILLIYLLVPATGLAQTYAIDWYKVAGGGGTSTGGVYSLSATIGQPDASGQMSGGSFSLTAGFWSLISVVQTAGLPTLSIAHAGNSVIVSWPNTGSYSLQQNSSLAGGGWTTSSYSVTTANGTNSITITHPVGKMFFRLSAAISGAPLATTTNASDISDTSATFNGSVLANGEDTTNWFEFNSVSAPAGSFYTIGAQTIPGMDTNEEPVSAAVTGLAPATTYSYQLVSSNALGVSYGGFVSFETSPLPTVQPAPWPPATALTRPRVSGR